MIFSQDETLGFHDASFTNTKNKSEFFKLAKIKKISDFDQFEEKVFTEPQTWCSVKSVADQSLAFHYPCPFIQPS